MKTTILLLVFCFSITTSSKMPLYAASTTPAAKEAITIVGSDLAAIWSAYFVSKEIQKRGLAESWEIHLIGEDLTLNNNHSLWMPLFRSGNIPKMIEEGNTSDEIQKALALQCENHKLTQDFLESFDKLDWIARRTGSYLAVPKKEGGIYQELFFNHKLPLTFCSIEELPPHLARLNPFEYQTYHAPFDSMVDRNLLHKLLLSYLLQERADMPKVVLHNTSCKTIFFECGTVALKLDTKELLHPKICLTYLESETFPLVDRMAPFLLKERAYEAVLIGNVPENKFREPHFLQFPKEGLFVSFAPKNQVFFYKKFVGSDPADIENELITQAKFFYPDIESMIQEVHIRPIAHLVKQDLPPIPYLFPYSYETPLILLCSDQCNLVSEGAAIGKSGSLLVLDWLEKHAQIED